MKKIMVIILTLICFLCSCGQNKWQEQYDLGMRYLTEGNYEEAILAFAAAIEIDALNPDAYIELQKAYLKVDNPVDAVKTLYIALEATDSEKVQDELDAFYAHYSITSSIGNVSEIGTVDNVLTMPSQTDVEFYDEKHNMANIMLYDKEKEKYYSIAAIDLKSEKDWVFYEEDLRIYAQHNDKLLFRVYYGPGQAISFIYSIKDNKIIELDAGADFDMYYQGYLDGTEDYILSNSISYDVYSYVPLVWYDWNGNEINRIENAQYSFWDGTLCYLVCNDKQELVEFNFYTAELDGQNEKYEGVIKERIPNCNLNAFFWDDGMIEYDWSTEPGEWMREQVHISELDEIIIP